MNHVVEVLREVVGLGYLRHDVLEREESDLPLHVVAFVKVGQEQIGSAFLFAVRQIRGVEVGIQHFRPGMGRKTFYAPRKDCGNT